MQVQQLSQSARYQRISLDKRDLLFKFLSNNKNFLV